LTLKIGGFYKTKNKFPDCYEVLDVVGTCYIIRINGIFEKPLNIEQLDFLKDINRLIEINESQYTLLLVLHGICN
jgi:hypothetical protein